MIFEYREKADVTGMRAVRLSGTSLEKLSATQGGGGKYAGESRLRRVMASKELGS